MIVSAVAVAILLSITLLAGVSLGPRAGTAPLGLGLLGGAPLLLGAAAGAPTVGAALMAVFVLGRLGIHRVPIPGAARPGRTTPVRVLAASAAASFLAHALVSAFGAIRPNGVRWDVQLLAAVSAAAATDLGIRVTGRLGVPRADARTVLRINASLAGAGALVVVLAERRGPGSAVLALGPLWVLTAALNADATARTTAGETIEALATLPEISGRAPTGHNGRVVDLAVAMAEELGLRGGARDAVRAAAYLHHLADTFTPVAPTLDRLHLPEGTRTLLAPAVTPAAPAEASTARTILQVACAFDLARSSGSSTDAALQMTAAALVPADWPVLPVLRRIAGRQAEAAARAGST